MATVEASITTPASFVDIAKVEDHIGNDAKKTGMIRQKKKTHSSSLIAGACIVIAVILADMLLLGAPDDGGTGWFFKAFQIRKFISSDSFSTLDFCWVFFFFAAYILMQLSCRTCRGTNTTRKGVKGITKKSKYTGRRDDVRTDTASKPVASNVSLAKAGKRSAVSEEKHQVQRTRSRWNSEIAAAVKRDDFDNAVRLLLKFESKGEAGCRPDVVSYNLLIHGFAKKGDVKSAEKWLQHLESTGIKATSCSYNSILSAYAQAGTWIAAEACEQWLERLLEKHVNTNVVSYASVVHAWARQGEQARAEMWMKRMIDGGIQPDEVVYNSMIHACSVSGNPAGAERWMRDMQDRGIVASVTTFATVIDACSKGGDLPSAEKLFETMLESKIEPNVMTFTSMIDACAKNADPDRAEYWFNRMVQCSVKPNAHSFSAIINACAKAKDAARAEEWLEHAENFGIQDGVIYGTVLDACSKASDSERAVKVFQRMVDNGIKPNIMAYCSLAKPFAYRGDWVEVERIAKEMSTRGIRPNEFFVYTHLVSYASTKPRQDERAEQCFRQALRSGVKANDHVVTALSRAVGRGRCIDLMAELCNGRSVPFCHYGGSNPSGSKAGSNPRPSPK